jgi:hypothetical protein
MPGDRMRLKVAPATDVRPVAQRRTRRDAKISYRENATMKSFKRFDSGLGRKLRRRGTMTAAVAALSAGALALATGSAFAAAALIPVASTTGVGVYSTPHTSSGKVGVPDMGWHRHPGRAGRTPDGSGAERSRASSAAGACDASVPLRRPGP